MHARVRHHEHNLDSEEKRAVEARNLDAVMGFVASLDTDRRNGIDRTFYSRSVIEQLHRLTVQDIYPCGGQIRSSPTDQVHVEKAGFKPEQPYLVPMHLDDLLARCRQLEQNPPERLMDKSAEAARIFHEFLVIHPFRGGNGRVARALLDLLLTSLGVTFPGAPISWYLRATRDHYFSVLQIADDKHLPEFLRFSPLTQYILAAAQVATIRTGMRFVVELGSAGGPRGEKLEVAAREAKMMLDEVPPPDNADALSAYHGRMKEILAMVEDAIQEP